MRYRDRIPSQKEARDRDGGNTGYERAVRCALRPAKFKIERVIEMKIIDIAVTELKEYKNNPRFNDRAVEKVAASIREFGFKVPVVIDADNVIVCGHTRVKAAKMLGLDIVPCIVADDLTPEQIKAFRVADNKTSEFAQWDFEKLEAELAELAELDFDMTDFGFTQIEEDDMMSAINDSGMEKTASHEYKLTFGNKVVIMTEDEYQGMLQRLDTYIDENGVSFGFVRWLLNE